MAEDADELESCAEAVKASSHSKPLVVVNVEKGETIMFP